MGMFDFKGGIPVKKGLQILFQDDYRILIRKLEIIGMFLVERDKDKIITRGWGHFYNALFAFHGHKSIPAGRATLSFERDVAWDVYPGLIPEHEKPNMGIEVPGKHQVNIMLWLIDVGNASVVRALHKFKKGSANDKVLLFLGSTLVLEVLMIGIQLLQRRGGG